MDPDTFADWMKKIAGMGVQAVGGCCGTTPEHIRKTVQAVRGSIIAASAAASTIHTAFFIGSPTVP